MTVMFRQRYNCLSSLNENRRIEVKHRNKNITRRQYKPKSEEASFTGFRKQTGFLRMIKLFVTNSSCVEVRAD